MSGRRLGRAITCADCLAWGPNYARGLCLACYLHTRDHPVDDCTGCGRRVAVKNQYCRLCWNQARTLAREAGNRSKTACRYLHDVREHQLFFADMYSIRGASTTPRPRGRGRGRPPKPAPPPANRPDTTNTQLALFGPLVRDYTRFDESADHGADNPWLQWGRYLAHQLAERRGWHRKTREGVDWGLRILLAHHAAGDVVHYTAMAAGLRHHGLTSERAADVLHEMDILIDDRRASFEDWLATRLDGLTPGIAQETEHWRRCLRDGGPRTRPRNIATAWNYGTRIRPVLLAWSARYDHLREVTRDDAVAALDQLHGSARENLLISFRSLFRHCKRNRIIFRDPTSRMRVGSRTGTLVQPLDDEQINHTVAATTRPADRLIVALAAIHAARTKNIRELRFDEIDIGNRRLQSPARSARSTSSPTGCWSTGSTTGEPDLRGEGNPR